jgi:hypothetical protein
MAITSNPADSKTLDPGTVDDLSDAALIAATIRVVSDERRRTAELLMLLAAVDRRRLYLGQGCASLFAFCTQVLRLSEHAAYHRIEAARAARRFPVVFDLVADGSITLTNIAVLRPHLTDDNHAAVLAAAKHKSKRDVEHLAATLAPKPDARSLLRRVPLAMPSVAETPSLPPLIDRSSGDEHGAGAGSAGGAGGAATHETARPGTNFVPPSEAAADSHTVVTPLGRIAPLSGDRFLLRVTLSASAHRNLRLAQDLVRHSVPTGDPAAIIEHALKMFVEHLEKTKFAAWSRPRMAIPVGDEARDETHRSRHIPASVKRAVWARDGGRCAFAGALGRCTETSWLEYHHVVPYARRSDRRREHRTSVSRAQQLRKRTGVRPMASRRADRTADGSGDRDLAKTTARMSRSRTRSGPSSARKLCQPPGRSVPGAAGKRAASCKAKRAGSSAPLTHSASVHGAPRTRAPTV